MDDDLTQRLLCAERDFLIALQEGPQSLVSFHLSLSALHDSLSTAAKTGSACEETLSLGHIVSFRVSNIASCFIDVLREEAKHRAQLQIDCDAVLHQVATLNLSAHPKSSNLCSNVHRSSLSPHSSHSSLDEDEDTPHFAPAYRWLLDNLHNPYPTAEVKVQIAAASSCQVSSISSWFINARRRIGWTALCREHFSNCRADMIDAASRALVEENPDCMLPPELRHSFVAMKATADSLYSLNFTRSTLTGEPDAAVEDTKDERKDFGGVKKPWVVRQAKLGKIAEHPYSSPNGSAAVSPVPALDISLTDESEEEEEVAPPIIAGSKRRRSCAEPENQPTSLVRRPIKRLRASMTSQTHLPSPPSSTHGVESPSDIDSPGLSSEHFIQSETDKALLSHERHVFATDGSEILDRQSGLASAPRPHTISVPSCLDIRSESIDDWFSTEFDDLFAMPQPVDATEPDFSTPWEVELFKDYCIPDNFECTSNWSAPLPHLSNFDSLLQPIGSDSYVIPTGRMLPSYMDVAPHSTFLDSSIPDTSHIDWTSLLDSSGAHANTIGSTFPQYPAVLQRLPDIDPSVLQLPPFMHNAPPYCDLSSKGVKLGQLHAMQEAVRRMEQELQSEGVVL